MQVVADVFFPRIGFVARGLLGHDVLALKVFTGPPLLAVAVQLYGFGEELIAIGLERLDVDLNYFQDNASAIRGLTSGMTLYASSADKALIASRRFAGGVPRAGDVPERGPVVVPRIDTIDVTAVGNDILGLDHDTFAGTRSVMDDIGMLLTEDPRRPPNRRLIEIRGVPEGRSPPTYFKFSQ